MAIDPITSADVTAFAAELGTGGEFAVSDAMWVGILNYVNQINLTTWDTDPDRYLARVYLAAHIGSTTGQGSSGAAGPVTAESAGGVRTSYGLVAMSSSPLYLATTRYGQMYMDIISMSQCAGPFLI